MFHISSPYFLHLFFRFLWIFSLVKNSNCFHHRSTDVCKHSGKGKTFYSNEFFLCKNTWISCTASASTDPQLRLCGTQTHLFSVATRYMMSRVIFVATPQTNATATRKESLWLDGFYSDSLKQTVDQLWEHCASWSYTRRGHKLIL